MPLRVISGSARGRKLKLVPGDNTRPIMDRVKEALFNIIGIDIRDTVFLDLFAGTGSVGIEALSRGAAEALFIDLDKIAIKTIHQNLAVTRLAEHAIVRRLDAFTLLAAQPDREYDYIYVAPPQYEGLWLRTLQALDKNPAWIPPGATVIAQLDPKESETVEFTHLELTDERRYGNTSLWFFVAREPEDADEAENESDQSPAN